MPKKLTSEWALISLTRLVTKNPVLSTYTVAVCFETSREALILVIA